MISRDVKISARVPGRLKALIRKYIQTEAHLNESDFIRDAIREKIQRDAPGLYRQLFRIRKEG